MNIECVNLCTVYFNIYSDSLKLDHNCITLVYLIIGYLNIHGRVYLNFNLSGIIKISYLNVYGKA